MLVCMEMRLRPKTLLEAIQYFATPANCLTYMVSLRWPSGVICPTCGAEKPYFDKVRQGWECRTRHPRRKFTLKTGTVFEDSPIPLSKWLPTVWMVVNMKNGVSSHEMARSLGVTQKTAWFMLHRVRLALHVEPTGKLHGDVEVDETFIGGKARNMHAAKRDHVRRNQKKGRTHFGKIAVMGLLERHNTDTDRAAQVRLRIIENTKRRVLGPHVLDHVEEGAAVYTDALASYDNLHYANYAHSVIDHAESYVNGNVHTNGLENFWSLLKRGLSGTYVTVEPFHLFRYLDEQAFRFNHRKHMTDLDRFTLALYGIVGKRLTYQELTGYGRADSDKN